MLGDETPSRPPGNSRGPVRGSGSAPNPHRDELYRQQAELTRIKAEKLKGSLVPLAEIERRWADAVLECRNRMLAIPDRMTLLPPAHRKALATELRAALGALAKGGGPISHAGKP